MALDPTLYNQYMPIQRNATGSVARNYMDKVYDIVSVKDFGAKGDNSTDDTAAIQAAINFVSLGGATGGGRVYMPPGTYVTSSTIIINSFGVCLVGAGKFATTIAPNFVGDCILIGTSATSSFQFCRLEQFTINPKTTQTSGNAVHVQGNLNDIGFFGIVINAGCNGFFIESGGGASGGGSLYRMVDCYIGSCTAVGVTWGSTAGLVQAAFMERVDFGACNIAMNLVNVAGFNFSVVDSILSTSHGLYTSPPSGCRVSFGFLHQVQMDTAGGNGWYICDTGGSVNGIMCTDCWAAGAKGHGVALVSSRLNGFTWTGGTIRGNQLHGMSLQYGKNVQINGAMIFDNSQKTTNGYSGIDVASGFIEFSITNCNSGSGGYDEQAGAPCQQAVGIAIETSTTTNLYVLTGNRGYGNQQASLLDAGPSNGAKIVASNLNG